jgi:2,4-dienoyl-CoA reductase-like NADH-dependent reductase (Old Yellow Enzyme family)
MPKVFDGINIASLSIGNRLVRSATAERAADEKGRVTEALLEMYRNLARGGVGLIITGHAYVRPDGKTNPAMTGAHFDEMIPGLSKLVRTVHRLSDAKIFLQINHAGRATHSDMIGTLPIAPSEVPVRMSGQEVRVLSADEIAELVEMYVLSGLRSQEAGFDGLQLHCAHGYLISQFLSPFTNRREDEWGGDAERRRKFLLNIIIGIKKEAPDFPLALKINCADLVPGGVELEEFVETCKLAEQAGICAIEVSGGIPESANKIIRKGIKSQDKEGYFLYGAKALKAEEVKVPIITVGGYRSQSVCEGILERGEADLISLCRPLITEPDLPLKWRNGKSEISRCISCNSCMKFKDEMTKCVHWEDKESL